MAVTNFTPLLGLALPTTGDLSGTWGTVVNDSITDLLDSAVAGTTTLSTDVDVTLSTTNGAANQARSAVLLCTGSRSVLRTITAPAQSKAYVVINQTTGGFGVKVVGAGPTTGVTIANGEKALIAWNGSDFVAVSTNVINLASDVTGVLPVANGGTGASSAPTARTNLGATTVGGNFFTLANPSAVTFPRINADNTVSTLNAADFRTAIGAGSGSGTVTSVGTSNGPAPINGLTLTGGPITSSGTVTLGGGVNVSTITTGVLPVANGGTGLNAVGSSGNVLTSNGTAWVSQAGGAANVQTFSAGGTYTKPPTAKFIYVEMWGAGGGGSSNSPAGGAGGGGGAYTYKMFAAPEVGSTVTVTVGAGGTGAAAGPAANGGKGGTTNFGTLLYAYGGFGAATSPPGTNGALGGAVYEFSFSNVSLNQATTALTSFRMNAFGYAGPSIPSPTASGEIVAGVWSGGSGGSTLSPSASTDQGKFGAVSMFGGGGGGGGGKPGNNPGGFGGMGRLYGAPTAGTPTFNSAVALFSTGPTPTPNTYLGSGGGAGGRGPLDVSPTEPINGGPGSIGPGFSGGGGGGSAPPGNPNANGPGGNGGIAGGGGGSGGSPTIATSTGSAGSGGNGYVVVYSWS